MTPLEINGLSGTALDLSVAYAEGWRQTSEASVQWYHAGLARYQVVDQLRFSTDWSLGGPIIEREHLSLTCTPAGGWLSEALADIDIVVEHSFKADAPLEAAMKAYLLKRAAGRCDVQTTDNS